MKKRNFALAALAAAGLALTAGAQEVEKGVLVEHYTGAWCGICPHGWETMEAVVEGLDNIMVVSVHQGDVLEIPEAVPVINAYIGGFPSATTDRFLFPSAGSVAIVYYDYATYVPQRLDYEPRVAVYAASVYDSNTRQLDIDVQAHFVDTVYGDIRFNCYIVEDSVVGPAQANGENDNPNSAYFGLGDPIVNYPHPNVVRRMLGSSWGTAGVIADTVFPGDTFSHGYSYTLPASWNDDRISLVAMVQMYHLNPNKREVLNILPLELNQYMIPADTTDTTGGTTGIGETRATLPYKLVTLSDRLLIIPQSLSGNVAVRIYNQGGQVVRYSQYHVDAMQPVDIPTGTLQPGVYLLGVEHAGETYFQRFVKYQ